MPKSNTKPQIKIICNIVPGKATEHHSKLWRDFWIRLLTTALSEFKSESERKRE